MIPTELVEALRTLGELLEDEGLEYELVVVGGAALMRADLADRPTEDLDVVAQIIDGRWQKGRPLPKPLVRALRDVARVHDLPAGPKAEKEWLNAGPSFLLTLGLPTGFRDRVETWKHGGLILRIASRFDQIHLKLWAATSMERGRRAVDLDDLRTLAPSDSEWRSAIRYCVRLDGRPDFFETDIRPLLDELGVELDSLDED